MDYSTQITSALTERLDVSLAFPIVYGMTPDMINLFIGSMMSRLYKIIDGVMQERGEEFVANNDHHALSVALMKAGMKLPQPMQLQIAYDIIQNSRAIARCIIKMPADRGNVWYCKLHVA